jgi:hypothetical protein
MSKMPSYLFAAVLLCACLVSATAQLEKPVETESEYEKNYAWRIRQERLDGVYIPRDLVNSFEELNRLVDADSKQKFKDAPEEVAVHRLYFSLGRWIIQKWGFYEGSRLSHHLRNYGIYHPEDMAQVVIVSYHRYLHRIPIGLKAQAEAIQEKRNKENVERIKKGTILHEERRKVDRN